MLALEYATCAGHNHRLMTCSMTHYMTAQYIVYMTSQSVDSVAALEQDFDSYLADLETTQDLDRWLDSLIRYCEQTKESADERWAEVIRCSRLHPLFQVIQGCPYHRALSRSRGLSRRRRVILDMIYHLDSGIEESATALSSRVVASDVFDADRQKRDSCESVRERKHELVRQIHRVADSKLSTRMLAIACGHLQEAADVECEVAACAN